MRLLRTHSRPQIHHGWLPAGHIHHSPDGAKRSSPGSTPTSLDQAVGGDVGDLQRRLLVPERCFELGEHAVVITDVPEFMRRFGAAIEAHRYRGWSHLVRYYDPSSFHGHFEGIEAVFRKRSEYSYQREYRFAIDTGRAGDDPLHLDIGDIRDITKRSRPEELNGEQFLGGTIQIE